VEAGLAEVNLSGYRIAEAQRFASRENCSKVVLLNDCAAAQCLGDSRYGSAVNGATAAASAS
jgi:hypothetical protein